MLSVTTGLGANTEITSYMQGGYEGIVAVIGVVLQTYFFGAAASAINQMDESKRMRLRKLESVSE